MVARGWHYLLLGSVAVVRHSKAPVLTVRCAGEPTKPMPLQSDTSHAERLNGAVSSDRRGDDLTDLA